MSANNGYGFLNRDIREVFHDRDTELPPPMPRRLTAPLSELPWMRREKADANTRRAISELRALAVEDTVFTEQYRAMADAFESALELLNLIEDLEALPPSFSIKVTD